MKSSLLLVLSIFLLCPIVAAQDTMLTREETVNYLHKKLQEADGRKSIWVDGFFSRYSALTFRIKGDNVQLTYRETFPNGSDRYTTFEFNPGHISKFGTVHGPASDTPIRTFSVNFPSKTVRFSNTSTPMKDVNTVYFPYFAALPENRSRMEKALLHLRDLYKAEDEPFGD